MDFFILDVVDVVPAKSAGGLDYSFYLVVLATILAEAVVMQLMKYNPFGRSLLYSLVANLVSVAAGFLLFELFPGLFSAYQLLNLLALMLLTVAIELPVLYLLNRTKPFKQSLAAVLVMNLVSYLLFYLYITIFTR